MDWDYAIYKGDCLRLLGNLEPQSVDAVITDLPYGVTQNSWDQLIDLHKMWSSLRYVCKPNASMIFTAVQPFTTDLIVSNRSAFKYDIVWDKKIPSGFLNANRAPLRAHEDILVFCDGTPKYRPQKTQGHTPVHAYSKKDKNGKIDSESYGRTKPWAGGGSTERFPTSVLRISHIGRTAKERCGNSTQKPIVLMEWIVETYTDVEDVILDLTMGTGTTGVAALRHDRKFIGFETDLEQFAIAKRRLEAE